jgi:hypothetical protein
MKGCGCSPARTPESLEELLPPRRAFILSLRLKIEGQCKNYSEVNKHSLKFKVQVVD